MADIRYEGKSINVSAVGSRLVIDIDDPQLIEDEEIEQPAPQAPGPVQQLVSSRSGTDVTLEWFDGEDGGSDIVEYRIEHPGGPTIAAGSPAVIPGITETTVFVVRAVNAVGESPGVETTIAVAVVDGNDEWSDTIQVAEMANVGMGPVQWPAAPGGLVAVQQVTSSPNNPSGSHYVEIVADVPNPMTVRAYAWTGKTEGSWFTADSLWLQAPGRNLIRWELLHEEGEVELPGSPFLVEPGDIFRVHNAESGSALGPVRFVETSSIADPDDTPTAPFLPSAQATVTDDSVKIAISQPYDGGSPIEDYTYGLTNRNDYTVNALSATFQRVPDGEYTWSVRANNAIGAGPAATGVVTVSTAEPPPVEPPVEPPAPSGDRSANSVASNPNWTPLDLPTDDARQWYADFRTGWANEATMAPFEPNAMLAPYFGVNPDRSNPGKQSSHGTYAMRNGAIQIFSLVEMLRATGDPWCAEEIRRRINVFRSQVDYWTGDLYLEKTEPFGDRVYNRTTNAARIDQNMKHPGLYPWIIYNSPGDATDTAKRFMDDALLDEELCIGALVYLGHVMHQNRHLGEAFKEEAAFWMDYAANVWYPKVLWRSSNKPYLPDPPTLEPGKSWPAWTAQATSAAYSTYYRDTGSNWQRGPSRNEYTLPDTYDPMPNAGRDGNFDWPARNYWHPFIMGTAACHYLGRYIADIEADPSLGPASFISCENIDGPFESRTFSAAQFTLEAEKKHNTMFAQLVELSDGGLRPGMEVQVNHTMADNTNPAYGFFRYTGYAHHWTHMAYALGMDRFGAFADPEVMRKTARVFFSDQENFKFDYMEPVGPEGPLAAGERNLKAKYRVDQMTTITGSERVKPQTIWMWLPFDDTGNMKPALMQTIVDATHHRWEEGTTMHHPITYAGLVSHEVAKAEGWSLDSTAPPVDPEPEPPAPGGGLIKPDFTVDDLPESQREDHLDAVWSAQQRDNSLYVSGSYEGVYDDLFGRPEPEWTASDPRKANSHSGSTQGTYTSARSGGPLLHPLQTALAVTKAPIYADMLAEILSRFYESIGDWDGRGYEYAEYFRPAESDNNIMFFMDDTNFLDEQLWIADMAQAALRLHRVRSYNEALYGTIADNWFEYIDRNWVPKWTYRASHNLSALMGRYQAPDGHQINPATVINHVTTITNPLDGRTHSAEYGARGQYNWISGTRQEWAGGSDGLNHYFPVRQFGHSYLAGLALYYALAEYFDDPSTPDAIGDNGFDDSYIASMPSRFDSTSIYRSEVLIREEWWLSHTTPRADGSRDYYLYMQSSSSGLAAGYYALYVSADVEWLWWEGVGHFATDPDQYAKCLYTASPTSPGNVYNGSPGNYDLSNMAFNTLGEGSHTFNLNLHGLLAPWDATGFLRGLLDEVIVSRSSHQSYVFGFSKHHPSHPVARMLYRHIHEE